MNISSKIFQANFLLAFFFFHYNIQRQHKGWAYFLIPALQNLTLHLALSLKHNYKMKPNLDIMFERGVI